MDLTLLSLVCLEYLEKVFVHVGVVGVASLDLVEVLDCVVELAGGSVFDLVVQGAEKGSGCGGGGALEGGDEGIERLLLVVGRQRRGKGVEGVGGLGGGAHGGGDGDDGWVTQV